MKINALFCVPSPRDIEIVENCLNILKYDKLYAKYFPEIKAYELLRKYFLKNKKYTHLVISPDDLLVSPYKVQVLVEDLEKHDFPILSGYCNVLGRGPECAITKNLPAETSPEYDWYTVDELKNCKTRFIRVGFSGFPCMIIRRDIVEKIPFHGIDCGSNQIRGLDVGFANSCDESNIPITVDTQVHFIHLKGILPNEKTNRLFVGIKQPKLVLVTPNTS